MLRWVNWVKWTNVGNFLPQNTRFFYLLAQVVVFSKIKNVICLRSAGKLRLCFRLSQVEAKIISMFETTWHLELIGQMTSSSLVSLNWCFHFPNITTTRLMNIDWKAIITRWRIISWGWISNRHFCRMIGNDVLWSPKVLLEHSGLLVMMFQPLNPVWSHMISFWF